MPLSTNHPELVEGSHYKRLYYHYDALGSVSLVTNEIGTPEQSYTYSPFGGCMNVSNDPVNSLQFIGRYGGYTDNDTGLIYFWHRWYNADDGRWVSRDPIGTCGGTNLYGYTKNNSLNSVDVTGLLGTYGNYCGGGWTSGTIYGEPNWDVPALDNLDACCKQHDQDKYECENGKVYDSQTCSWRPRTPDETKRCIKKSNKKICECTNDTGISLNIGKEVYKGLINIYFQCWRK